MSSSTGRRLTTMDSLNLRPVAIALADLVDSVSDDDLARPTPCPAFTVENLLDHIRTFPLAFAAGARKERGPYNERTPSLDTAPLAGDWRTEIRRNLEDMAAAWSEPGAWQGMTRIAGMDSPAEMTGRVAAEEVVVHGWDLARAIGADFRPDPAAVAAAREFLDIAANPDNPAGPDVPFGPPTTPPPDASALEQVIALAGRDVDWRGSD